MAAFNLQDLFQLFLPVIKFLKSGIEYITIGLWDLIELILYKLPYQGGIIAQLIEYVVDKTEIPIFLNQFNLLTFTIGFGIIFVIVITIVQFIGDTIGF